MRVFILTGEPSGDLHGAHLAEALHALDPDMTITGTGGVRMREAGVRLVANSEHWGAIGIPEALQKSTLFLAELLRLLHLIARRPARCAGADRFRGVQYHAVEAAGRASPAHGVFHPPGMLVARPRSRKLPFLVDGIATPFPWSADNLRTANGAGAH